MGKSHLIKEILKDMLSLNLNKDFDKNEMLTSFNLIILISYSLFEEFDVDLNRYKKFKIRIFINILVLDEERKMERRLE